MTHSLPKALSSRVQLNGAPFRRRARRAFAFDMISSRCSQHDPCGAWWAFRFTVGPRPIARRHGVSISSRTYGRKTGNFYVKPMEIPCSVCRAEVRVLLIGSNWQRSVLRKLLRLSVRNPVEIPEKLIRIHVLNVRQRFANGTKLYDSLGLVVPLTVRTQ